VEVEELVSEAKELDLALLRITGVQSETRPFPVVAGPPTVGETVYILTGLNDGGPVFVVAKVEAVRAFQGVGTLYLLDGKVDFDYKGSPVLSKTGELYGMFDRLSLNLREANMPDKSFVTPVALIQERLKRRNIPYATWKRELSGQWHLIMAQTAPFLKDENAQDDFRVAIAEDPTSFEAYFQFADFLRQQGRTDEAISIMEQGVQKNPTDAEFQNGLGWLVHRAGRTDDALRCYQKAVALAPHYEQALLNLGSLLLSKGDLDQAERIYKQVTEQNPDSAQGYMGLGSVHVQRKNQAGALRDFRLAVQADPQDTFALTALGFSELDANNPRRALDLSRQALDCTPEYPEAYLLEARAYAALGDPKGAETSYLEVLQAIPDAKEVVSELGLLLAKNHQWAEAEAQAEKLKSLDPALAAELETEIAKERGAGQH
jgi:tetratricopeptide (TPR) repeat protein